MSEVTIGTEHPRVVLASASPRRIELLGRLGVPFIVRPAAIDETLATGNDLAEAVAALAERKARAVAHQLPDGSPAVVLGADTVVCLDGQVLGKPVDDADATRMLRLLRGQTHTVITGVAVIDRVTGRGTQVAVSTMVTMRDYKEVEIAAYISTGEPRDKAGSYAIQGAGGALVAGFAGCYLTIVGLPLCATAELLRLFGIAIEIDPVCVLPSGAPCPRLS